MKSLNRQLWYAVLEYLQSGNSPGSKTAKEIRISYKAPWNINEKPVIESLWNGKVEISHYWASPTPALANRFDQYLTTNTDFIVVGSLLHDIRPISKLSYEERKQRWPKIIQRYQSSLEQIMEKVGTLWKWDCAFFCHVQSKACRHGIHSIVQHLLAP